MTSKCKIHPYQRCVGVCAPCLRDRLLAVISARESGRTPDLCRDHHLPPPEAATPPPVVLPGSVSPLDGQRRSFGSGHSPTRLPWTQRFFSTPQVGPVLGYDRKENLRGSTNKFSILTALFGSGNRSGEIQRSKSSSWIFGLFPGRRKKRYESRFLTENPKSFPVAGRGMSPQEEEEDNGSACSSGYTTETSAAWHRPEPTPVRRFPVTSPARSLAVSVSGFAMCLSPLARPTRTGWLMSIHVAEGARSAGGATAAVVTRVACRPGRLHLGRAGRGSLPNSASTDDALVLIF